MLRSSPIIEYGPTTRQYKIMVSLQMLMVFAVQGRQDTIMVMSPGQAGQA